MILMSSECKQIFQLVVLFEFEIRGQYQRVLNVVDKVMFLENNTSAIRIPLNDSTLSTVTSFHDDLSLFIKINSTYQTQMIL